MAESNYFSRGDDNSIAICNELSRRGTFFIEERETQMWIFQEVYTELNGIIRTINSKTNNPDRAKIFKTKFEAMTFMVRHKLKNPDWYITEHEFC